MNGTPQVPLDPLREVSTTFAGREPCALTHLELMRLCTWDMHAAGSYYLHQSNYICLTNNPNRGMLPATPGTQESGRSLIYGVEYSLTDSPLAFGNLNGDYMFPVRLATQHCMRGDKIMIPGLSIV